MSKGSKTCPKCFHEFTKRSNLVIHLKKGICELKHLKKPVQRDPYTCQRGCDFTCKIFKEFQTHVTQVHGVPMEREAFHLETMEDFLAWKDAYEDQTTSSFTKCRRTIHKTTDVSHYVCNRSGFARPRESTPLRKSTSIKINQTCTASLKVKSKKNVGFISVEICHTHFGHEKEISKLRMKESERKAIMEKLQKGWTVDRILASIDESIDGKVLRKHFVSKKDIKNIKRSLEIKEMKENVTATANVEFFIQDLISKRIALLHKNKSNSHLYYCYPEFSEEVFPPEDFVLGLQTVFQKNMLLEFGNNIVCIDAMNLELFDLKLITVLVIDNENDCIPVAWLVSNKDDFYVLKIFFQHVKNHLENSVEPKALVTNNVSWYFNAWIDVFPSEQTKHLISMGHVLNEWRLKTQSTISDEQEARNLYRSLIVISQEVNCYSFEEEVAKLMKRMSKLKNGVAFSKYFKTKWLGNRKEWALCYRKDIEVNSLNKCGEAFHEDFLSKHPLGKFNEKLDTCVNSLVYYIACVETKRTPPKFILPDVPAKPPEKRKYPRPKACKPVKTVNLDPNNVATAIQSFITSQQQGNLSSVLPSFLINQMPGSASNSVVQPLVTPSPIQGTRLKSAAHSSIAAKPVQEDILAAAIQSSITANSIEENVSNSENQSNVTVKSIQGNTQKSAVQSFITARQKKKIVTNVVVKSHVASPIQRSLLKPALQSPKTIFPKWRGKQTNSVKQAFRPIRPNPMQESLLKPMVQSSLTANQVDKNTHNTAVQTCEAGSPVQENLSDSEVQVCVAVNPAEENASNVILQSYAPGSSLLRSASNNSVESCITKTVIVNEGDQSYPDEVFVEESDCDEVQIVSDSPTQEKQSNSEVQSFVPVTPIQGTDSAIQSSFAPISQMQGNVSNSIVQRETDVAITQEQEFAPSLVTQADVANLHEENLGNFEIVPSSDATSRKQGSKSKSDVVILVFDEKNSSGAHNYATQELKRAVLTNLEVLHRRIQFLEDPQQIMKISKNISALLHECDPMKVKKVNLNHIGLSQSNTSKSFKTRTKTSVIPKQGIGITNSASTEQFANVNPVSINTEIIQPVNVDPVNINRKTFKPVNVDPLNINCKTIQPVNVDPLNINCKTIQPVNVNPLNINCKTIQPENVDPLNINCKTIPPVNVDPVIMEPGNINAIEHDNRESVQTENANPVRHIKPINTIPLTSVSVNDSSITTEPVNVDTVNIEPVKIDNVCTEPVSVDTLTCNESIEPLSDDTISIESVDETLERNSAIELDHSYL